MFDVPAASPMTMRLRCCPLTPALSPATGRVEVGVSRAGERGFRFQIANCSDGVFIN
jgi:hypothetical protein